MSLRPPSVERAFDLVQGAVARYLILAVSEEPVRERAVETVAARAHFTGRGLHADAVEAEDAWDAAGVGLVTAAAGDEVDGDVLTTTSGRAGERWVRGPVVEWSGV